MNKPPKIVIITPFESRLTSRGTRLPVVADKLVEKGADVRYVTSDFSHAEKRHFTREEIARVGASVPYRLDVIHVPAYRRHFGFRRILCHLVFSGRAYQLLRGHVEPCTTLVIPARPPELIAATARIKKLHQCRLHMDLSDLWPQSMEGRPPLLYAGFTAYCNAFQRRAVRQFDSFSHVSPCAMDWLRIYGIEKSSLFIPLGFDLARWGTERPPKHFDPAHPRLVYVGTLTHHFDLSPLLLAMKATPHATLTIVGDGDREAQLRELARTHSIPNVVFKGRLPPEGVVLELDRAHIGVTPEVIRYGTLPNKVFDYVASETPILVMGSCDTAIWVQSREYGWAIPLTENAARDWLTGDLLKSWNHAHDLLHRQRQDYSKDTLYDRLIERLINPC